MILRRPFPSLLPTALAAALTGLLTALAIALATALPASCRADLPLARWQRHDLSMLQGCWRRLTDMQTRSVVNGFARQVQSWTFCFGFAGAGQEHVTYDGGSCSAAAMARFHADDTLEIDTAPCPGRGYTILPESFPCRWRDPSAADCPGYLAGGRPVPFWPGGFHPGLFVR